MANTHTRKRFRAVIFPDPPEPAGATPATLGGCFGDEEPFFEDPAVGLVRAELDESQRLKLTEAVPGQVASLLGSFGSSAIDRIDVVSGVLSPEDLKAISASHVADVRFGTRRYGIEAPDRGDIRFLDGLNLSKLRRINALSVDYVPFTDKHLSTLGTIHLESLRLAGTGAGLECVDRFPYLRALHVEGKHIGRDLSQLSRSPLLQCLDARFTSLAHGQLEHLRACADLRVLCIGYNAGLEPDLSPVGRLRDLFHLDVSTSAIDDTSLPTIKSLWRLDSFTAQRTGITDDGVGALAQWPGLARLHLGGTRITDAGLERIVAACPGLADLDLRSTDVTESGLADHLVKLPNLRVLGASGDVLSSDLAGRLKEHTAIAELIVGSPMDGRGWIEAVDWVGAARMLGSPV